MQPDLCRDFHVVPDDGGWRIVTPWRYGDNDHIVVWATHSGNEWVVDDNGEAAFRLALDGGDPDSQRVRTWLETVPGILGARWNPDKQCLEKTTDHAGLSGAVHTVAEISGLLGCLALAREPRLPSSFKDEVIGMLHDVARETGIEARFDVPIDERRVLIADCLFVAPRPLAVIVANSVERLLEAELAWSEARRRGDITRVVAINEGEGSSIPRRRIDQAQFFTDQTLPYRGFEALLPQKLAENIRH
ncbi:MAG: DUF1828 domain-containing protein [Betaproteobacteria bacterium]|nr:DUF1828 domain-containing protein [Betaproteobacteria bacterium]